MNLQDIEDIVIRYDKGDRYSKTGYFPAIAWYILKVLNLESRFEIVTVKSKRNNSKQVSRRQKEFTESKMSVAIIFLILLQVERFSNIEDKFSDETILTNIIGLKRWFSDQTAYNFIKGFNKWHVEQLKRANTKLLMEHGVSTAQTMPVIDIDMSTFSLECRKREGAVPGYNKKNRGKPCYQWNVAFCEGEIIDQYLGEGNTASQTNFQIVLENALSTLSKPTAIIRLDSGYLSAEILNTVNDKSLFVLCGCRYDWIMAQKANKEQNVQWEEYDEQTWLFDLGITDVVKEAKHQYRVVLVKKKQEKIKIKKCEEYIYYGLVTNFYITQSKETVYEQYHQRQTIENFFREVKNPFNAGKMPSNKLRGNQAYMWYTSIAYNCFMIFKKTVYRMTGESIPMAQLAIDYYGMDAN